LKVIINTLLILGSILISLLVVELAVRGLNKVVPPPARSWLEYRSAIPLPYKESPFDVSKLIAEALKLDWVTDKEFGYRPKDFHGEYINIENGYRRTVGNAPNPTKRIWVFGGSTIICVEVADAYTVPSHLSKMANAKFGNHFEVINSGATTISSRHQLYRLKHATDLKKGDLVVFMDGWNDISQSLYYDNPSGNMIESNREQIAAAGLGSRIILQIYTKLGPYSAFVSRFLNPFKPEYKDIHVSEEALDAFQSDYLEIMKETNEYVKSKGAKYYHFLQPSIYTLKQPSMYEKYLMGLLAQGYLIPKPLIEISKQAYPRLQSATQMAIELGINAYDITGAFDHKSSEVYLDPVHVNEVGNRILAEAMLGEIRPELVGLGRQ
jgi:lysophospholipase L1-like esterase